MTKVATKKIKAAAEAPAKKGWRIKQYYIDLKAYEASKAELSKAPNQVQIMVNHFATKFNEPSTAAQGRIMCQSSIDEAGLKTVIEPHVLFAYYRKTMEQFGLRLAN
jgi:hypothetical protein